MNQTPLILVYLLLGVLVGLTSPSWAGPSVPPVRGLKVILSADTARVAWSYPRRAGKVRFDVFIRTGSGAFRKVATVRGGSRAAVVPNLSTGSYTFRVVAVWNGKRSPARNKPLLMSGGDANVPPPTENSVPDSPGEPEQPVMTTGLSEGFSAIPISTSTIRLEWSIPDGVTTGYEINRSNDGVTWGSLGTTAVGATSFINGGRPAGTQYYYRIRPAGTTQPWRYADAVTLTTGALPNPPSSLFLTVLTAPDPIGIGLDWTDNSINETSFVIERSQDGTAFEILTDAFPANNTSANDVDLPANTKYFYRVRAKNAAGVSSASNIVSATTRSTAAPGAPQNLTATPTSANAAILTWNNPTYNEGYDLEEAIGMGAFSFVGTVNPGNVIGVVVDGLNPSTAYRWRLRAFTTVNGIKTLSAYSAIVTATTFAAAAQTGVRFRSSNKYPIVSLRINGVEQFASAPQAIPPEGEIFVSLPPGTYTYSAANGFWQSGVRNTLYTFGGSVTVTSGQTTTIQTAFPNPTIQQLMLRFNNAPSILWSGWHTSSSGFTPTSLRFFPNGACTLSANFNGTNAQIGSGNYVMTSYPGSFLVNFNVTLTITLNGVTTTQTYSGLLDERLGYFGMAITRLSPFAIQFNYDGP